MWNAFFSSWTSILQRKQAMSCVQTTARSSIPVALLLAMVVGCVRTIEPVLKDEQVIVDKSLVGNWVSADGLESAKFELSDDGKTYNVRYTDRQGRTGAFIFRLGKIGGVLVSECQPGDLQLDLSDAYKAHLIPVYSFFVVNQTTPKLRFSALSSEWLGKYLSDHPNELRVIHDLVISSTDEFQAFLLKHLKDEGAFGKEEGVWVRPGDPTTRPIAPAH
jgi:hypothetical protein